MASHPTNGGIVKVPSSFVAFPQSSAEKSIVECFEEQVSKNAARLAVKAADRTLAYGDLNRQANRVANAILQRYTASAEPIAILCKPSAALIIASIAVLKTGRAFVPLDSSVPAEGLATILQDLGARVILCDSATLAAATNIPHAATVVNIDEVEAETADSNPGLKIAPGALAYIHYTSGSTGAPKGVMANHRSEIHNIMTNTNALRISAEDRISLVRANNVGATRDTLLALLNGATLLPLDLKQGLVDLGKWLAEEQISVFTCVTSVFRHAVKNATAAFPKLRLIHVGGEAIVKGDVDLFKKRFSDDCVFVSRLGLSETETLTYYFITKTTELADERVPVGYPLEGNEILLLDDDGNDVGFDLVGEIVVRSEYLSMGYWRQSELTQAKFVADPRDKNIRRYYTGDLGKRLPDGCFVHMGRKDFQVKIRGHRVEIPAVEVALMKVPAIEQAVVGCHRDPRGANRLVAYVVPKVDSQLDVRNLREHLEATLAPSMLPTRYVVLDALPLTSGGKVDRGNLPIPDFSRTDSEGSLSTGTVVERALRVLWGHAFGFDGIGADDDFSELGGDSLLATQLGTRVMECFGPKKPVNIYQTPTVAKLALFVELNENQPGEAATVAEVFLQIESMPDAEIERLAEERRGSRGRV